MRRKPKKSVLRSSFEDKVVADLNRLNINYAYESVKLTYTQTHTYTPDIVLSNNIIVELKGYFKPGDRGKHKRVRMSNPELDIRFVFQNARKTINKTSKTTYGDWADKNGFKWAEGSIPLEWIKESSNDSKV